eukprot:8372251-Pyramimonas_sp.AAC.1
MLGGRARSWRTRLRAATGGCAPRSRTKCCPSTLPCRRRYYLYSGHRPVYPCARVVAACAARLRVIPDVNDSEGVASFVAVKEYFAGSWMHTMDL